MFSKCKITHRMGLLCASALLFTAAQADAAGFYLQEQSISGLGSAFAGQVATPRDASIVYFNPAGMTKLDSAQMSVGTHLLMPKSELTNTGSTIDANPGGGVTIVDIDGGNGGNPYDPEIIPNLSVAYPINGTDLWIGFAVSTPFGLANEYDEDWFGRFDSTKTELLTLDFAPSLAYKANDWLSIGGGINIQRADAELEQVTAVTTEGLTNLNGEDVSMGYNLGFLVTPNDTTTLGVHYRSEMNHDLDGRITTTGSGGGDFTSAGTVVLDLPDILQIGVNQKINDKLSVMGGATWFGWDNFEEIAVISDTGTEITSIQQGYRNTWAFAVGAEYAYTDTWTLRAGYQFDETPTTDEYRTSRTPDGDRNWFSLGATYQATEKLSIDMAATYIDIADETININRNIPTAVANITADTEGSVGILAVGLNYKF